MAKDESFDVVSEVNLQEVDNAYQQTKKEMTQRYDLKGNKATLEFDKSAKRFTLNAPSEFVAKQVMDVLESKFIQRKVELAALRWSDAQDASGMTVRYTGDIVEGIDKDLAGRISKNIRDMKLKRVKVQIEGSKLRVISSSRDDLQEVISFLKEKDYGQPLQYTNYR